MDKTNQQRVYDGCEALLLQGQKITVRALVNIIPSIKSTSTVHKYLQQWNEDKQGRITQQCEMVELSEEVVNMLKNEIQQQVKSCDERWKECVEASKAQREEAIEDLVEMEERFRDAQSQMTVLDKALIQEQARSAMEVHCLQKTLDEKEQRIAELKEARQHQRSALEDVRIEKARRETMFESQQVQMETLKNDNEQLHACIARLDSNGQE